MFCPKCGQRNEDNYKFCRDCGENLKVISKAMERRWLKLLYRALDGYIRRENRKLRKLPDVARGFRHYFGWLLLMLVALSSAQGLLSGKKDWWVLPLLTLPILLTGFWDYVSYRRFSALSSNDNKLSAQAASLPDSAAELPSATTTNELAPPFSVTEPTTRRLEPLAAAEKRSGELV